MARRNSTENKGAHVWEGTVPLLMAPENAVCGFARAFAKIGNDQLKWYEFGVVLDGGGVFQGRVDLLNGNSEMVKRWLSGLPRQGKGVLDEISAYLQTVKVGMPGVGAEVRKGQVIFGANVLLTAPTGSAVLAYMMASILKADFGKNIRCCPQCARIERKPGPWFTDFPKGRRIKTYCTPAHQNAFAQREWQEANK